MRGAGSYAKFTPGKVVRANELVAAHRAESGGAHACEADLAAGSGMANFGSVR